MNPRRAALPIFAILILGLTACTSAPQPTASHVSTFSSMVTCMEGLGWELDADHSTGTFHVSVPAEQAPIYEADWAACASETGFDDVGERLDAEGAANYYRQLLEVGACLEAAGYTVAPPPSEQSFVDDYLSGGSGGWTPYAAGDPNLAREQLAVCAQPTG